MNRSAERFFEQFIRDNEEKAMKVLLSRFPVLSKESVKDIIHDSLVTLYKNIEVHKIEAPQYPYFLKICINLSLKAMKKQGKHLILGINDTDILQKDMVSMRKVEDILQVCDEQELILKEKQNLVHEALGNMATRCRELLWSFYADELGWATIASQYGLKNADTAKSQASRCRQTFKEKYNHLKMSIYGR